MTWIFGYGSLVWRPAFPHLERVPARVHGFTRRFWQGSTDHRGVPGAPGRVVTLIPSPEAVTWGTAYRVGPAEVARVTAALDHREKGGYARHEVTLHLADGRVVPGGLVYIATPENPDWLGHAPIEAIARQVAESRGPSGPNDAYVLELAAALRAMGADDPHVSALEAAVRRLRDG